MKARQATNRLLEMIEEGMLDSQTVMLAALNAMSDTEVRDMAESNEFFEIDYNGDKDD